MELRHLRYFIAVAEELHFGRAAARLFISQPPLSQQVAALEQELGVMLLKRDKRHVKLTKAGEAFLYRARAIVASSRDAVEEAQRIDRGHAGQLIVGFMSAVMLMQLTHYLRRFHATSPGADVTLRQMQSHEQYLAVLSGQIDVGFVDIPPGDPSTLTDDGIEAKLALNERLVLCVSNTHPLANRDSVTLKEFADSAFITLVRQAHPSFFDTCIETCKEAGFRPRIVHEAETMPAVVALAAAGFGVALVPQLSQMAASRQITRFIPIKEQAYIKIYCITRSNTQSALIDNFRAAIQLTFDPASDRD